MAFPQTILARVLPFALYILFLALADFAAPLMNSIGVGEKWLYAIRVVTVSVVILYFWRSYSELKVQPTLNNIVTAVAAGLLVFLLWILPYPEWTTLGADAKSVDPTLGQDALTTFWWLSIRILGAALVVPVMEELFWRSFVMRWLDNKDFLNVSPEKVTMFAFIASSILFALEHQLWLAGLLAGLIYAQLYKVYKNLWVPIISHAVTNGLLGVWVVFTGNWQYW
ncbi:MAG TPA: CAAX prenyl protease-related protein [Methylotenera sp.]|nr:CAAX prenyl protease-related protein [Methylotenera sp.]